MIYSLAKKRRRAEPPHSQAVFADEGLRLRKPCEGFFAEVSKEATDLFCELRPEVDSDQGQRC